MGQQIDISEPPFDCLGTGRKLCQVGTVRGSFHQEEQLGIIGILMITGFVALDVVTNRGNVYDQQQWSQYGSLRSA